MKILEPCALTIVFHAPEGYSSIEHWLERVNERIPSMYEDLAEEFLT
jgi:hypothetical protein